MFRIHFNGCRCFFSSSLLLTESERESERLKLGPTASNSKMFCYFIVWESESDHPDIILFCVAKIANGKYLCGFRTRGPFSLPCSLAFGPLRSPNFIGICCFVVYLSLSRSFIRSLSTHLRRFFCSLLSHFLKSRRKTPYTFMKCRFTLVLFRSVCVCELYYKIV